MANYRNVSMNFWTDSKVDDDFTPEDKYFYLYLLTNPHTTICGCYEISFKQMERETGYNSDTIRRLLSRMQDIHSVIKYSSETKEVLVLNWFRYNWSKSEKVKKAVLDVAKHIKSEHFKKYVIDMVSIVYSNGMDTTVTDTVTVSEAVTVSETVTESETETVSETENRDRDSVWGAAKPPTRSHDSHPSVEDVKAYCREIGSRINAKRFVDYYTANGWKQSKGCPITDWKAVVRIWDEKERKDNPAKYNSSIDPDDLERVIRGCVDDFPDDLAVYLPEDLAV